VKSEDLPWRSACTYPDAPHEYLIRDDYPEVFEVFDKEISKHGVDQEFTLRGRTATYRYYYADGYMYWIIGSVLNRCSASPPTVLSQERVSVSFAGPFSWEATANSACLRDAKEFGEYGIYLWTVRLDNGYLINYVGETGDSFKERLRQHHREMFAARYYVYSAAEFARGEKVVLWPGRYAVTDRKSDEECLASRERLSHSVREMLLVLRFFLAPLSCDRRTRQRIEAALANGLHAVPGKVGAFQDEGVRYLPRKKDEKPIECTIASPFTLLGLPHQLLV